MNNYQNVAAICIGLLLNSACVNSKSNDLVAENVNCESKHWAGWANIYGVGDFPFRLRQTGESAGGLDLAAAKLFNTPVVEAAFQNGSIQFVWVTKSGSRRAFKGYRNASFLEGEVDWNGSPGTFSLKCAARPIAPIDAEEAGLESGYYFFPLPKTPAKEAVWFIDRAGYGETYVRVLSNGQQRVAFPMGDKKFFFGQSLYDPSSISTVLEIDNDASTQFRIIDDEPKKQLTALPITIERRETMIETPDGPIRTVEMKRNLNPLNIGIILAPGSNWAVSEDETFRAESLAALGFTVITFDKRGFGQSPGMQDRPFRDTARDIGHVADWASGENLNVQKWGVLAISRGGWIAPLIPDFNQIFDFAVLLVSPAVTPYEQEFTARRAILREDGMSDDDQAFAERYFNALVTFAKTGNDESLQNYKALHSEATSRLDKDVLGGDPDTPSDWIWWRLNGDYDPQPALSAIRIPTLALLGADDLSVPVEPTASLMRKYGGHDTESFISVQVIPDVGHGLALTREGPLWELDSFGAEGIEEIRQWILATVETN